MDADSAAMTLRRARDLLIPLRHREAMTLAAGLDQIAHCLDHGDTEFWSLAQYDFAAFEEAVYHALNNERNRTSA